LTSAEKTTVNNFAILLSNEEAILGLAPTYSQTHLTASLLPLYWMSYRKRRTTTAIFPKHETVFLSRTHTSNRDIFETGLHKAIKRNHSK
jgi:hypothetical protein